MSHQPGVEVRPGVYTTHDPKFYFDTNILRLVNAGHGRAIPDDVPVFMLLAHDKASLNGLEGYLHEAIRLRCAVPHLENVVARCDDFFQFNYAHPKRMKLAQTFPVKA